MKVALQETGGSTMYYMLAREASYYRRIPSVFLSFINFYLEGCTKVPATGQGELLKKRLRSRHLQLQKAESSAAALSWTSSKCWQFSDERLLLKPAEIQCSHSKEQLAQLRSSMRSTTVM